MRELGTGGGFVFVFEFLMEGEWSWSDSAFGRWESAGLLDYRFWNEGSGIFLFLRGDG